jgi:O-antigen/teichoic acid export membrane protein
MVSVVRQLVKNVFTSWAGMVVTLAITFFFTPYLIEQLGKSQYGIWSLVFSLIAYMKLADVGMNQAIAKYVPQYYAQGDYRQLNQVMSSAARIYILVSLAIVLLSVAIAYGLLHYFKIEPEYLDIARITLVLIGVNQAVTYVFIPFAALLPFHRADILNYFEIGTMIIQTCLIVVMLELGFGLVAMAMVVLGLNIISHLWRYRLRQKMFPMVKFSREAINSEKTRQLLTYGTYSLLIVAAWIVIFQTSNIVIGRYLSIEAVAVFSVPAAIVTQLRHSINAIAVPIVPTISHIDAHKDDRQIMTLYLKATRYLYYLSALIVIGALVFGGPFILLWVKEEFTESIIVLYVLIVPAAVYLPQMIANSVLFGVNKHKTLFFVLAAEGLSNIVLSLLLVKPYGLLGVALGTAIPQMIIYLFVYPYVFHRAMERPTRPFYITAASSTAWGLVFGLPVALALRHLVPPSSWGSLLSSVGIVATVAAVGFLWLVIDKDDRHQLVARFRQWRVRA